MPTQKEILSLYKKRLALDIQFIRLAIQHNAVKGGEAELAFKALLRKQLPRRYELSSGFIVNEDKISNQHDIVVYDNFVNSPMFLSENSGVFLGGAVYGVVEVTIGLLNSEKLKEDIKKIGHLRSMFSNCRVPFKRVMPLPIFDKVEIEKGSEEGIEIEFALPPLQRLVVSGDVVYFVPPPRTYICALDGTSYRSAKNLSSTVRRLAKKYGAHVHGLLILREDAKDDWLISTIAHRDCEVTTVEGEDAFYMFLESMKRAFQVMAVGRFPAAEVPT